MSLRVRILLLVLAASLLPVLAMLWLLLQNRASTGALAHEQLQVRAEIIARELDDKIAGTVQLMFGLARVPVVGSDDKQACSAFLADVLREHPQYTGLITIKPDGQLFCDSLQSNRALDLSDRNYFKRALVSQEVVVEAAIGRLSHKGVLQVVYPVRDSKGSLSYIMLASLNMDAYGRATAMTLPYANMNFQIWNDDGSLIMNHQGQNVSQVLASQAQRDFMLNSKSSGMQILDDESEARFWVRALLPRWNETGLRLALSVSESDLNEQIDGQFRQALFSLLALAALIFTVAFGLGEFAVRRQAARLIKGISRMDNGDYHELIGQPYPRGELGEVMQALDRMACSLAQQQQEIERKTEALERQARVDALTGLANRYMLTDRLDQALVYARRAHRIVGVLMLDLDRFKTVNDSLGHSHGDQLLQVVAARLINCVRDGDTVARLGGDEFVVVLADMEGVADIVPVAQKILATLALPVELGMQQLNVHTSLGVAIYPRDGENADGLLRSADTAMYRAKDQGGNAVAFYTPEMMQAMLDRLQVEAGLRRALAQDELCVYFQPIVNAHSGRVTSAEALLRWNDPQRGLVAPIQFIPIAEETGLIVPMGDWVLRTACTQARAWQKQGLGDIPIAVNISARQFGVSSFVESVTMALQASDCPASLLQLEITESLIMKQVDQALATMHRLTALGVKLAIDDFGTGYSSLSQLKRFPVSKLKIDHSFIRDIQIDANDDVLVDAIITLAKKLELSTVAEGVESEAQLAFLQSKGCDEYQGFLFAKPCDAETFSQFVRARNAIEA